MADFTTPPIQRTFGDIHIAWREFTTRFNSVLNGKHNAHGTFTLAASVASTVVNDARAGGNTKITYSPTTANASAEIGAGTIYVSAKGDGTFTLTHANNAQTDRDFDYSLSG